MTEQEVINRLRSERPAPPAGFEARQRHLLRGLTQKEEPQMKRKMSLGLVLAMVLVLLSMTAFAASLVFSKGYEAARVANSAMREQYGITDDLLSLFHRRVEEHGDGKATVTYEAPKEDFPAERMGVYTVEVDGNKAAVTWSNDGKDTGGGLTAEAYGPEQLREIAYHYGSAMQAMTDAGVLAVPAETERSAASDEALQADMEAREAETAARAEAVKAKAKVTLEEAAALALDAICGEYGLTDAQREKIIFESDETWYEMKNDQPTGTLLFWLWQSPAAEDVSTWNYGDAFTEKDGRYMVTVNLENGVIEDVLYDSGLAGNG